MKLFNVSSKNRSFLATTALDDFWDKTQPLLFLGDWCLPYCNKNRWENLDAEVLSAPLLDYDPDTARQYVETIYNKILPTITKWLNQVHQTHHSLQYWEIIIGSFLFLHIQTVYDRYERLKAAYSLYPQLQTIGLAEKSCLTPLNISEYYNWAIENDVWNLQLLTHIINSCFNKINNYKTANQSSTAARSTGIASTSYKLSTKLKCYLLWIIIGTRGNKSVALIQHDFSPKKLLQLALKSKLKILPALPRDSAKKELNALTQQPNYLVREELNHLPADDLFSKLALELLVINMPMSFIENFGTLTRISKKHFPYFAKVVVGSPVASGEVLKIWQANNLVKGMKRVGLQHGGGYGALKSISDEYLEHKTADFYITWGKFNNEKIIGLPSVPVCELFVSQKSKVNNNINKSTILWITTEFTPYPMPEIKLALGAGFFENLYYTWQRKIISSLLPDVFANTKMRLRFSNFTDSWKWLAEEFPDFNFHKPTDKSSFYSQIWEAKLLLFDNLNTTHLYGLALNIPSILFWDEKIWTIKNEVRHLFEDLKQVGIFHTSPEAAASMINEISTNPEKWWNQPDVQKARENYCQYFVGDTKEWLKQWQIGLTTLLSA